MDEYLGKCVISGADCKLRMGVKVSKDETVKKLELFIYLILVSDCPCLISVQSVEGCGLFLIGGSV